MSYYCSAMKYQLMADLKQQGDGRYAPCCHFEENIELEDFQVKTKEYLSRLMNGEKLKQCRNCWVREDVGLPSVRTSEIGWKPSDGKNGIRRLDIRIHNKCNLACTMCYSGASNLWGKLEGKDTFRKISDTELEFLKNATSNVERISFQGGEPFYGSEYDDFLMSLPNKKNIEVDVFTNLITAKPEVISRWKNELKKLYINASVDGYGEVYDSIRWPTTWSKWEKSAKSIYEIVQSNMSYFWVIQAENLYNIFDFIKWRDENTPKSTIVITLLVGDNNILGLDTITNHDRQTFLNLYINYLKKEYDSMYDNERLMLGKIRDIVKNVIPSETKIQNRLNKMKYISEIRKKYTGK